VTRRTELPSDEQVHRAKTELLAEAHAAGTRPTVIALARSLGLTNPTFWRHYPDIAREVAGLARSPAPAAQSAATAGGGLTDLKDRNAELRRANRRLTEHLELAVANIQRLTLDNHQLRRELEAAAKVVSVASRIQQRS
jgi:hypothetical protein